MTPDDATVRVSPAEPAPTRRAGRLGYVLAGFTFVFLGGSVVLWLLRKPVAEQALSAWCGARDLQCDGKFTELDASGITVSAVKVSSGAATPAEAAEIRANLRWTGLFTPQVTGVTVNGLSLQGTLGPQGLRFGGLERLVQTGGGGGPAPSVEIRDAHILIATPAGQANLRLSVTGALATSGTLTLRLEPAELAVGKARADFREGRLNVRAVEGQVEAELGLRLNNAAYSDYGLDAFDLLARADFQADAGAPASIEWSMRADRIASPGLRATDIRTSGSAEFAARPAISVAGLLGELSGAVFEGEADTLTAAGYTFDAARFEGELAGRAGNVSGPLIASAGIGTGPSSSVQAISLAGEVNRRKTGAAAFEGKISVSGAALDSELRRRTGAAFSLPGVLSGHADALRNAFSRALSDFGGEAGLALTYDGKAASASGIGAATLQAASGLNLDVTPAEGAPWVNVTTDGVSAQGMVSLSGGGAPSARVDVDAFRLVKDAVTLQAAAFDLANWSVGGRSLSASLQNLKLDSKAGSLALAGSGVLSFSGEVASVRLASTKITGGLEAGKNETGWRVQSIGAPCLGVDTAGLSLGAIRMAPAKLNVCPVNGRFMKQGPVPSGSANLGDVRLPFTMESGSGVLSLEKAAIDWTAAKTFALSVKASDLELPMTIANRTLTMAGETPRIDVQTGKGPARIAARLGKTRFGGTLIPANVSSSAFTFDGVSAASGISGDVAGTGVLITDINTDPLYLPVTAGFVGTVGDNKLHLAGPLELKGKGVALADAVLDLDLLKLDGTASVVTRPLNFADGGLQPDMISGRFTGLFTEASGSVSADARFAIEGGDIAGTAEVNVRNFGFQTVRLGRVDGINGTIMFADLMKIRTAPAQVFTVARVNPGIPLTDGRIVFDLREDAILHLDTVTFPFGGGTLALAPFDWALEGGLKEQSVAVTADAIGLAEMVEILKLPDTVATGTVSGKFPIAFSGNSVLIRDARLKADDPGGRLSYTGGAVDAAAGQDANASLAFDALRDLKFDVLEIGVNGDLSGDMRADILLAGENIQPLPINKNVVLPAGQAFEFAIGFDLPIGKMIESNLGLLSQQDVIDAALELLDVERAEPVEPQPVALSSE